MKIAFITQSYPPMISGASIVVQRLAEGMAQRGHTAMVLAASERGDAYTEKFDNLSVVRMKSIKNPKRANQQFVPGSFSVIHAELSAFKPDLIHTHDVFTLGISGLVTGRQLDIPVIATIHQLPWFISAYLPDIQGLKSSVENGLWQYSRLLDQQFYRIIVPTITIARTIKEHAGFDSIAISNGVDLDHFEPVNNKHKKDVGLFKKYDLDPKLPIILHVGRLDTDKNVDVVIRAAANVMEQVPAQLLVVGDGECRKKLMDLSMQLGISKDCLFPGFVDPKIDLPGIYRISTVFTTASEIETQGLVLLEAMACGLPVVAVDATCVHEVVKHQENGFLIQPGDQDGISRGLIELLQHRDRAQQMGEAGRSIVRSHSIQYSLDKHEMLYQESISSYQKVQQGRWVDAILVRARMITQS